MFKTETLEVFAGAEGYGDATADELDEGLGEAPACGDDAELEGIVFAGTEIAGAVAHAADPSR